MKDAYLWVIIHRYDLNLGFELHADLVFSTPTKCKELLGWWDEVKFQIVKIKVPEDFTDWDYIPDNY